MTLRCGRGWREGDRYQSRDLGLELGVLDLVCFQRGVAISHSPAEEKLLAHLSAELTVRLPSLSISFKIQIQIQERVYETSMLRG